MIGWLLFGWPGQVALLLFVAWIARGVWKATRGPRLKYVSHTRVVRAEPSDPLKRVTWLLEVERQERLPPWRTLKEIWLLEEKPERLIKQGYGHAYVTCTRESDGLPLVGSAPLAELLQGLLAVARIRDAELEQLTKQAGVP